MLHNVHLTTYLFGKERVRFEKIDLKFDGRGSSDFSLCSCGSVGMKMVTIVAKMKAETIKNSGLSTN
jgi:hypothetical protein